MAGTCKWRGQRCAWWWLSPGAEGLCVPGAELDDPYGVGERDGIESLQKPLALLHIPKYSSLRVFSPS